MALSWIRRFFTRPNPELFPEAFAKDAQEKAAQSQAVVTWLLGARDWIIGLGEAVVLAVFFRVAATHAHSFVVWVLAFLMMCAVGAYVGMPFGALVGHVSLMKTKWLRVFLGTAIFCAWMAMSATNYIGVEVSGVIDQIIKAGPR